MAELSQARLNEWVTSQATGKFHYTKVLDGTVDPKLYPQIRVMMMRCREKGLAHPVDGRDGWWRPTDTSLEEICWWEGNGAIGDAVNLPLGINKYCSIPLPSVILVAGKYNAGKALRNGTPVLTPNGWKNIEDINVGDTIYTASGNETQVLGCFPQGYRECYRFTFNDGSFIDSDTEHNWQIMSYTNRIFRKTGRGNTNIHFREWETKTTNDIVKLCGIGVITPHHKIMFPSMEPVKFPHKNLPLDPYILGLLLGDGSFKKSSIIYTTADDELIEAIRQSGIDCIKTRKYEYRLRKFMGIVDSLGLHHKRSHEKFVPADYLFNSVDVRLSILQGLLDTDGTIDKSGKHIEFVSVSERLAQDVMFLVRSLGGRASIHSKEPFYKSNGRRVNCKTAYRISIKFASIKPFRLKYKLDRCSAHGKTNNRILYRIDSIALDHTTCIKIADSSGLFVTKDFIVTHNSAFCLNVVNLNLDKWAGMMDFYVSEGAEMIKGKLDIINSEIPMPPPFRTYRKTQNFADVIDPNNLSVIDYLRVDMDKSYSIGNTLFEIFNKLNTGIAIVAMQKPPGDRKLAFGGASTAFEPSLYLWMDKDTLGFEKIKVVKPTDVDPYSLLIKYKIYKGAKFYDKYEVTQGGF